MNRLYWVAICQQIEAYQIMAESPDHAVQLATGNKRSAYPIGGDGACRRLARGELLGIAVHDIAPGKSEMTIHAAFPAKEKPQPKEQK